MQRIHGKVQLIDTQVQKHLIKVALNIFNFAKDNTDNLVQKTSSWLSRWFVVCSVLFVYDIAA